MSQIKTEVEGILRDTQNGALLNTDNDSLSAYKKLKRKNKEFDDMKVKIKKIDNDIAEIKNLLVKLVEK